MVVNFIGQILPRCDQGDRELTMLALFKPWRTGFELKEKTKSWDDTFNEHEFTKREKQLMRNFNIKYECLDARDDFHAQMKTSTIPNEWPINCFDENDVDDDETTFENDPYVDGNNEDLLEECNIQKLCQSELSRLKDAGEIKAVLQRTGWLDERANINPHSSDIGQINSTSHLPPPTWKTILQQKKQHILDSRMKSIQTNAAHAAPQSFTADVVKVIDKSYLDKRYHTTKHNNLMDTISQQHTLNEQERAFRIIANHIVLPNSEPLKMYIGGMGGTGKSQVLKAVSDFFQSRNEAYRFVVVAPTGTAAALLSGSTYHSVFGINDMSSEAQATKTLMQV
jgi:hypothetical protein